MKRYFIYLLMALLSFPFGVQAQKQLTNLPTVYISTTNSAEVTSKKTFISATWTLVDGDKTENTVAAIRLIINQRDRRFACFFGTVGNSLELIKNFTVHSIDVASSKIDLRDAVNYVSFVSPDVCFGFHTEISAYQLAAAAIIRAGGILCLLALLRKLAQHRIHADAVGL